MFSVEEKAIFVTGGASGIGLAVGRRLASAGARVVLADLQDASVQAAEIGARYVELDVTAEAQVERALDEAEAAVGPLDAVLNNAGIGDLAPFAEMDSAMLRKVLAVNVEGVAYGLKHAPAHMRDGGAIVNTASLAGVMGISGYAAYSASKAAVMSLTRTAAVELGARGIRVNAICPGTIETPIQPDDDPEYELSRICTQLGRFGQLDDVTGVFHFLVADESRFMTGQALIVDGGWSAGASEILVEKLTGSIS